MKEEEEERDVNARGGEQVRLTAAVSLKQSVPFQLAQVVTELIQTVGFGRELELGEDGFVHLFGGPAADGIAAMQQTSSNRMVRVSWILIPG